MEQFNFNSFIASLKNERQQRDTARLIRAAWGVGATHPWFRKSARVVQEGKVRQWVGQCLADAAERRQQRISGQL